MTPANQSAFPYFVDGQGETGLTKREYFAAMAMQGLLATPATDNLTFEAVSSTVVGYADALLVELNRVPVVVTPGPAEPPTGDHQPWPLPPHLRVPRLVGDVWQPVRSTGTDATGNYYEDFYADRPVFRDRQGYFQIDDGAVHVSYLNLPGASIEHRLVPRPGSGATKENTP